MSLKFWKAPGAKRIGGIALWLLGNILQLKGVVDPATASIIKDSGIALGAAGVVHAQVKAAKAPASTGGTG